VKKVDESCASGDRSRVVGVKPRDGKVTMVEEDMAKVHDSCDS
jgi:hypothetical protein